MTMQKPRCAWALGLVGWTLASCGSECTDEGCSSGILLRATFDSGTALSSVEFCHAGNCQMCPLDGGAASSSSCSGLLVDLSSEGDAGKVRLAVASSKPPFNDGEALSLVVTSVDGRTLIDWKGTAQYTHITTGGPRCDTPGHCQQLTRDVP
jgi:hypothetical protein